MPTPHNRVRRCSSIGRTLSWATSGPVVSAVPVDPKQQQQKQLFTSWADASAPAPGTASGNPRPNRR
eukprot:279317-Prymnesium_polylepis.1